MTEFSNDELLLLSACVLKTISDMHEAKKSIIGYEVKNKIEEQTKELQILNDKILQLL